MALLACQVRVIVGDSSLCCVRVSLWIASDDLPYLGFYTTALGLVPFQKIQKVNPKC